MIKNPDFSLGAYRACATIAGEVAHMRSLPHPTFPRPLPVWERTGAWGKVRALGVLRSTGAEPVATLFPHVVETHAVPVTLSLTIMAMSWARLINSQVFDHPLRDFHRFHATR